MMAPLDLLARQHYEYLNNLIGDEIMIFKGSGVALVTPFEKDDVYKINYDCFKDLIRYHIQNSRIFHI